MRSRALSLDDLQNDLCKVIPAGDEVVLVYSGIWTFGHRFKLAGEQIVPSVLDCIEAVVGKDRTLILPTYTYAYNKTRQFNIQTSKPETGVLPERFLQRAGVHRSHSAISSFGIKGPRASELIHLMGHSIWGKGSLIEWFDKNDIRVVTLGLPWAVSCGYLHRIEEVGGVPYRYYKDFPGTFTDSDGIARPWCETMFVRSTNVPSRLDWSKVSAQMDREGNVLKNDRPGLQIESSRAHSIVVAGMHVLASDPYALVTNKEEVRQWVVGGGKDLERQAYFEHRSIVERRA